MGKEFKVSSLEEMCDLMCDNITPEEKTVKPKFYGVKRYDIGFDAGE